MLSFWDRTVGKFWRQNYYYKNINDLLCCMETHESKNNFKTYNLKSYNLKTYEIKNQIFLDLVLSQITTLASTDNYECNHFNKCPLEKNLEEVLQPPKCKYLKGVSYCKGMRRYIFICFDINECYDEIYETVNRYNYNSSVLPPLLITLGRVDDELRKYIMVVEKEKIMRTFSYPPLLIKGLKDYEDLSWANFIKVSK